MTDPEDREARFEALLSRSPPVAERPEFADLVLKRLRRAHLVRAAIIAGSVAAGLGAMLSLVPLGTVGEVLALLAGWLGKVDLAAPGISTGNGIAGLIVAVLFLISLMATQES